MGVALFVAVSVALASGAVFRTMVWMSGASVSVLAGYALSRLTSQGALNWRGSWIDVAWIAAFLMTAVAAHQDDGSAWCGRGEAARGVEAIKIAVVGLAALLTIALSEHVGESAMGETLASGAVVVLGVRLLLSLSNESRHADTLEHLAETDALTGLANRRALEAGRVDAEAGGVLLFDLDDFKQVNDSLGHRAGDLLLRAVAARVAGVMESDQRLYRLGGDEFAIVCPTGTREDLVEVAHRVLGAVVAPVIVDGVSLRVGASVGVAPQRAGRATGELLRRADVAMYGAKAGHSGVEVYEFAHDRNDPARLALYGLVRDAVESGTIGVHFQPLWGLSESTVIGYEALARWNAPGVGEVEPARFVPMIEIQGLTAVFTDLVLDRALETAAHLGDASGCRLSVNVTADDLARDGFAERVLARCATHGVASERLTLEVVESAFSVDTRALVATITTLRASGIRISLDDFGTGFSSLSRLGRLPVDEVKIDRSILVEALASSRAATVLRSTVTLAHDLGIDVVVEGIESEAALALITELGADVAQGFLIGRPGPAGTCAGRVAAIRAGWSIEGEDGVHEVAD